MLSVNNMIGWGMEMSIFRDKFQVSSAAKKANEQSSAVQ